MRVLRTESSTQIYDVEYDETLGRLRVRFHRGGEVKLGCWEYSSVPAWLFEKLCQEEEGARAQRGGLWYEKGQKPFSVGRFFHKYIKRVFPETRVRPPRDPNAPKKPPAKAKAEPKPKARRVPSPRPPEPRRTRRVLH